VFTFFPAEPGHSITSAPSLHHLSITHRPHWTVPVSREETLAVREEISKGWLV
jgi:hypothetical protein